MLGKLLKSLLGPRRKAQAALSVGMAAYGNAATTRLALEALFASASGDFELILVDDKSPDDTLEVFLEARRVHADTRVFAFDRNLEYCESVNAFLSHARGENLLFLSNDIFASPAYLRTLPAAARAHPECGILRGSSNFVDNHSPAHNVDTPACATQEAYFAFAEEVADRNQQTPLLDERFLVGDAFLVTRRAIERIGTYDTRFIGYCADMDYGLRAQIGGLRVVLERGAFAFHNPDANLAYLPEDERQRKVERRRARVGAALAEFARKYGFEMEKGTVHDMPWEELARRSFEPALHYVAPKDYSEYLLR